MIVTRTSILGETAAISIVEDKHEFGDRGLDPSTQTPLSYAHFWAQSNRSIIRENSCCPSFLIAIADAFYKTLEAHSHPALTKKLTPRYFPSINVYCGPDNTTINFTFIAPLEFDPVCTTFLAQTEGPSSQIVVVTFVHRYNKEAHELLAAKDMAPKLHYCGKVGLNRDADPTYGHLRIVIMNFVDGKTVDNVVTSLPLAFLQRVRDILNTFHGDLRGPNIMITRNNEVGKHGVSMYFIMMSPSIKWPQGVGDGLGVMLKEHDLEMLQRLFQEYCA